MDTLVGGWKACHHTEGRDVKKCVEMEIKMESFVSPQRHLWIGFIYFSFYCHAHYSICVCAICIYRYLFLHLQCNYASMSQGPNLFLCVYFVSVSFCHSLFFYSCICSVFISIQNLNWSLTCHLLSIICSNIQSIKFGKEKLSDTLPTLKRFWGSDVRHCLRVQQAFHLKHTDTFTHCPSTGR